MRRSLSGAAPDPALSRPSSGSSVLAGWLTVWLALSGAIAWSLRDVLTLPPYEDQGLNLWLEAEFLLQTDFDYWKLRYEEPHFNEGRGVRSCMISVLPSLLALLLKTGADDCTVFAASHLFEFFCAAAMLTATLAALKESLGWGGAILTTASAATTPLLVVQMEMIGMEIPTGFFMVLAGWATWRFRFAAAAVASTCAFLFKPTGMTATLATLGFLSLMMLSGRSIPERLRRIARRGFLWNGAALAFQAGLFLWGDPLPELRGSAQFPWLLRLPGALAAYPDVAILLATAAAGSLWTAVGFLKGRPRAAQESRIRWMQRRLGEGLLAAPDAVVSWLFLCGLLASMSQWMAIPRYFACFVPFLFTILGRLFFTGAVSVVGKAIGVVAALTLLCVNVANLEGSLYPDLEKIGPDFFPRYATFSPRSCVFSERSREYRRDLESVVEAMAALEKSASGSVAFVPDPYYWAALRPRLGFVRKPVRVYPVRDYLETVSTLTRTVSEWKDGGFPVMVWSGESRAVLPPPDPERDEILYKGPEPAPLVVYRKRPPQRPWTAESIERWFLETTWPGPYLPQRTLARMGYWSAAGQSLRAARELQTAVKIDEPRDWLHQLLVVLQAKLEDDCVEQRVAGELLKTASLPRASAQFPWLAARDLKRAQGLSASLESLFGIELSVGVGRSNEELLIEAFRSAQQGASSQANLRLDELLTKDDRIPEAWSLRATLALQAGRREQAESYWQRSAALDAKCASAHFGLALISARRGEKSAFEGFLRSMVLDPSQPDARRRLRRLLMASDAASPVVSPPP